MAVKISKGAATTVLSLTRGASSKPHSSSSPVSRLTTTVASSQQGDAVVSSLRPPQSSQTEVKIRDPIDASEKAQDIAEQIRNDAELLDELHGEMNAWSPPVEIIR